MDKNTDNTTNEALASLEKFVVDNDDLLKLEERIGRFNIFDALNIARAEIRHSNFLAFILDPAESHGQSQLFLRALLMDLLKTAPPHLRPLSPIEIDGVDLRGVEVRREWKNIDLLITAREPEIIVAIENKVDSDEHSNQLIRYAETIRCRHPAARPLLVFLTPDGSAPSSQDWVPYSYSDLHGVLSRVRHTYENAIGDDVLVFLDHYLKLIGTHFMNDPQIDALCKRIYKNHRQALELIYERAGTPSSAAAAEVEEYLRNDPRWHVFYRTRSMIDFVPSAWIEWLPPLGMNSKDNPQSWIIMRFEARDSQLDFYAEVRRMQDLLLRRKIVDMLLTEGTRFGFARKQKGEVKVGDLSTLVSTRERVLEWSDEVPDAAAIHGAVKKKLDDLHPKLIGVRSALAPILSLEPE